MKLIVKSSLLLTLIYLSGCASNSNRTYNEGPAAVSRHQSQLAQPAPSAPPAQDCQVAIQFLAKYDPAKVEIISSTKSMGRGREDRVLQGFCTEACRIGADLVNIKEEKQPNNRTSYYFAKVEYVRLTDRSAVKYLRSDISYAPQYVGQRIQEAKQRSDEQTRAAVIGGAFGGAIGAAIGAAAAGR